MEGARWRKTHTQPGAKPLGDVGIIFEERKKVVVQEWPTV